MLLSGVTTGHRMHGVILEPYVAVGGLVGDMLYPYVMRGGL